MKKIFTAALAAILAIAPAASAEKEVKTGWTVGLLPALTYSTDMGLQYGAFGDFYYELDMSEYKQNYRLVSFEESIERTEK